MTCAFGIQRVTGTLLNSTHISVTPLVDMRSQHLADAGYAIGPASKETLLRRHVALEVSMDGVSFTTSNLQYTYYDADKLSVAVTLIQTVDRATAVPVSRFTLTSYKTLVAGQLHLRWTM